MEKVNEEMNYKHTKPSPRSPKNCVHENQIDDLMDRCFRDAVVKTATGGIIGSLITLVLLQRNPYPILFGLGFGLGFSASRCDREMRDLLDSDDKFTENSQDSETQ